MFFLGVTTGKDTNITTFIIIKKFLKDVKKHYQLKEIISLPADADSNEVEKKIADFYNNRTFIITKKIFNQNKRPSKIVKAHPGIIVDFTGKDTNQINRLRKNRIPIEGISKTNADRWKKEKCWIGLGSNYYVPESDLLHCLVTLCKQKRFIIEKSTPAFETLIKKLEKITVKKKDSFKKLFGDELSDVLTAISITVWFRETIRYKNKYITSSRVAKTQA